MNREEYLSKLITTLREYEVVDIYDIMAFYEQVVNEILYDYDDDIEQVINKLGQPEELAKDIVAEFCYDKKTEGEIPKENLHYKSMEYEGKQYYKPKDYCNASYTPALRTRSNIIWHLILVMHGIFQAILISSIVIILTLFFIPNTSGILMIYDNNDTTIEVCFGENCISICNDTNCNENINFNNTDNCALEDQNCTKIFDAKVITESILNTVLIIILSVSITSHIFIYRTIKKIVKGNDEYNRRLTHE